MTVAPPPSDATTEKIVPTELDILCGKTKNIISHPGTIRYQRVVESYVSRYIEAESKYDKMGVTKSLYDYLKTTSRFLKWNEKEDSWEEISALAARDKVGHALRFAVNNVTGENTNRRVKGGKRGHRRVGSDFSVGSTNSTSHSNAAVKNKLAAGNHLHRRACSDFTFSTAMMTSSSASGTTKAPSPLMMVSSSSAHLGSTRAGPPTTTIRGHHRRAVSDFSLASHTSVASVSSSNSTTTDAVEKEAGPMVNSLMQALASNMSIDPQLQQQQQQQQYHPLLQQQQHPFQQQQQPQQHLWQQREQHPFLVEQHHQHPFQQQQEQQQQQQQQHPFQQQQEQQQQQQHPFQQQQEQQQQHPFQQQQEQQQHPFQQQQEQQHQHPFQQQQPILAEQQFHPFQQQHQPQEQRPQQNSTVQDLNLDSILLNSISESQQYQHQEQPYHDYHQNQNPLKQQEQPHPLQQQQQQHPLLMDPLPPMSSFSSEIPTLPPFQISFTPPPPPPSDHSSLVGFSTSDMDSTAVAASAAVSSHTKHVAANRDFLSMLQEPIYEFDVETEDQI